MSKVLVHLRVNVLNYVKLCSILFVLGLPNILQASSYGAPLPLGLIEVDRTIYVNNKHLVASDSNPGTADLPLKTVGQATTRAIENRELGLGTKILVAPGVYREKFQLIVNPQDSDPPIVFEATEIGKAIISGSDVFRNWKPTKIPNIFVHAWPYKWGVKSLPESWKGRVNVSHIVRRKEMVFVNGIPLKQVLSAIELVAGTFFATESTSQLFIALPGGLTPSESLIEVAIRSRPVLIKGKTNLVLKGLTFQHAASDYLGSALVITDGNNVTLEDLLFSWNNGMGYFLHNIQNLTSKRNETSNNGASGYQISTIKNLLSEDDKALRNNWRGVKGEFVNWGVAGFKGLKIHDAIFRRHMAQGNHTTGFWLDYDNRNIRMEDGRWCGNRTYGLFVEASERITITNAKIYQNNQWGFRTVQTPDLTLTGSRIYANRGYQLIVQAPFTRMVNNWETGERIEHKTERWQLTNNIISGDHALLITDPHSIFLNGLFSDGNIWMKPSHPGAFRLGEGGKSIRFPEWQSTAKQDQNSFFIHPDSLATNLAMDCIYPPAPPPTLTKQN
ncbi:right-handed parallel beta-helix repeat-containing protein [Nitrospira sp. MA-1]|nr:right-handed parallel beta-helix repeat-containing protein [Nitrospira sp. MA-1]